MVWAWAAAGTADATSSARAPSAARTECMRGDFIVCLLVRVLVPGWPRRRGARKVANPSTAPGGGSTIGSRPGVGRLSPRPHQPLEPAPSLRRAGRRPRLQHREAAGQGPLDVAARDGEGRPVAALAQGKEAGEQDPARPQDGVEHARVLVAPGRVDGAEARVLPDPVEGARVIAGQGEDVARL